LKYSQLNEVVVFVVVQFVGCSKSMVPTPMPDHFCRLTPTVQLIAPLCVLALTPTARLPITRQRPAPVMVTPTPIMDSQAPVARDTNIHATVSVATCCLSLSDNVGLRPVQPSFSVRTRLLKLDGCRGLSGFSVACDSPKSLCNISPALQPTVS
jgi:hypothetical protein